MIEERFELVFEDYDAFGIRDGKNNKYYNSLKNVVDLLNELDEIEEKNKHLRKSIKRQQSSNNECSKLLEDLNDENQMFREVISQILYELKMDHTRGEASIMVGVPYSKRQIFKDLLK